MSQERVQQAIAGTRHKAVVPDTLELAERAALAINGIGGCIDPALMTMYGIVHFCTPRPHQTHWASAETTCDPKFGESFPLMRLMSGSEQHLAIEADFRAAMRSRIEDGLYWDRRNPARPWRNSYAPAFYGEGRDEDFATLVGTARMLRALLVWRELGDDTPDTEAAIRALTAGLRRIAVCHDDYCYYPEKGGWGEPCAYPRSGWLNTDEAQGETEGGEGSVICMHGHQIYAAAHWYGQSGDPVALDLAARLTRYCMLPKFWGGTPDPDPGHRPPGLPGHIAAPLPDVPYIAGAAQGHWYSHFHARAIALRGMLEYAWVAGDEATAEFVRRSYEYSLTQGIARIGWINCYPGALNTVEGCALGDLVGLGIRLSDYGLGDYWDDVDAVVRNQLAEQQLVRPDLLERVSANCREPDSCEANPQPGFVCYEDTIARSLGTYSGTALPTSIPKPWVMHCCTGNATQGLYAAWEGAVREAGERVVVNLLLNRASRLLDVDSCLPYAGKVVLGIKAARRVALRVPHWVDPRALRAEINGAAAAQEWIGRYLTFENLAPGDTITVTFPVRETETRYTVNAHSPAEQEYTCVFRGSTLVDISPRDESPTSYPLYLRDAMRCGTAPMKTIERFVADRVVRAW
jgi:hypothetical protein